MRTARHTSTARCWLASTFNFNVVSAFRKLEIASLIRTSGSKPLSVRGSDNFWKKCVDHCLVNVGYVFIRINSHT